MGLTNSSERYVVSESVATKLVKLGDLLCTAGDSEIGKLLKQLCDSPDRIFSVRNALLQTATSSEKLTNDPIIWPAGVVQPISKVSSETLWLQRFNPQPGKSLTDAEQTRYLASNGGKGRGSGCLA